uniref:NADH-ubiquinone oxidoreductase chain 3 n=1 Tax=Perinereis cultrifera TaxID=59559 RepID=A0A7G8JTL5_PERCL|nr:NADH dehydrogenase subunit 3 [Perinereis cultrifera]QNJ33913.1 NADH dehydrogenase subunit 3 [Perinereis cultrifera]
MMIILLSMFIASLLPIIIFFLTFLVNKASAPNFEKSTPFECGFDPHSSARIPFSLRFFILAVLFLVFDIEIALLMPVPSMMLLSLKTKLSILAFSIVLALGLFHEWKEGSLEWK